MELFKFRQGTQPLLLSMPHVGTHLPDLLARPLKKNEAMLDTADGLDWETAVRCDIIHLLPKASFGPARGRVSSARQIVIARKLAECLRLRW